eukprot:2959052-Amphidinium_carterae.1
MEEARQRIEHVHTGYKTSGLIRKEAKAQREVSVMTLWGATVDGENKTVRGALDKIKILVTLTKRMMAAKTASSDERMLGYGVTPLDASEGDSELSLTKVRDEFMGLILLWPLLQSDLQVVPAPRACASDATVTKGAVVESELLSEELAVFYWSRRKQKIEEMVRSDSGCRDLYEFPAAERPQQRRGPSKMRYWSTSCRPPL